MSTLSIFDAAREAPDAVALVDAGRSVSFLEVATRCEPLAKALVSRRPPALALTPRADLASLLWIYAAFATGTPLLTLHQRSAASERAQATELVGALEPPEPSSALKSASLPTRELPAASALVFIPTSGSTGTPRLVELSRDAVVASARASAENLGWLPDDRWLLCLPLAHTGGLSIVTRCLLARRAVVLFEPGEAGLLSQIDELAQAAQAASLASFVPSVLGALLERGFSALSLRAILLGGAACTPALARRCHAAGLPLLTSYGLTETASQVVTRRYAERFEPLPERDGIVSSGHPLPGVSLRLRGELLELQTPTLFTRYIEPARAGAAKITPPGEAPGSFWLTSDRGELGECGELYVRGRSDDVIVTGGENVDPLEVEAALLGLDGVRAACVFGTASNAFGEVVTAVLVASDARLGDPRSLTELLRDRLARQKLPRRVLLADTLPLTKSGKVDRHACRELYLRLKAVEAPA